jgi:hypothetical protein
MMSASASNRRGLPAGRQYSALVFFSVPRVSGGRKGIQGQDRKLAGNCPEATAGLRA